MSRSVPETPHEVWAMLQAFMDAHSTKEKLRERVGQVRLLARALGDDLHLTIIDNGSWRPARSEPDPNRGHGLKLMRALMQHVDLRTGATGTTVEMSTRITP